MTINSSTFPVTSYGLEINGQIASGSQVQVLAGSLAISTNFTHTFTTSNNISYTLDGRTVLIHKGNAGARIIIDANLTSKCAAIENDIITLSNELLNMVNTSGNNISMPKSQPAPLNFNVNKVDANGMAVFSIDGNTAFNNLLVQSIQVVVNPNITNNVQLVVINLSGTNVSFSQGNMVGTWLSSTIPGQSQTIWNFYQATSISLSRNWMGVLLAPYASVSTGVSIKGTTAVKTLVTGASVNNPLITPPSCV
jgi:choice-of-anchor A domain-containing protein